MTECGPLISYTPWRRFVPGSAGRVLKDIMEAKIVADHTQSSHDGRPLGEIAVRGLNVMKGYYKNPEATEAALDSEGWLHTGDMGTIDNDGRTIFIRGRYKTMILSANGQNIYPEEIEAKINKMPYVSESLVVDRDGHLVALVHPDSDAANEAGLDAAALAEAMEVNRREVNKLVAPYENIDKVELVESEFEKTPKRSIRRFLYK